MTEIVVLSRAQVQEIAREAAREAAEQTRAALLGAVCVTPPAFLYKEWLTTDEVARVLGVTDTDSVYRLRGIVESRKPGRARLWKRSSLMEYIEGAAA